MDLDLINEIFNISSYVDLDLDLEIQNEIMIFKNKNKNKTYNKIDRMSSENNSNTLKEIIKKNKPNISFSTLNTYLSNIRSTANKIGIPINNTNDIIHNSNKIFSSMNELKTQTRKSKLASFIVALDIGDDADSTTKEVLKKFRLQMNKDIVEVKDKDMNQELTPSQKENFVPWNQVMNLYKILETEARPLFKLRAVTTSQFQKLMEFILMSLYTQIPPRRALDYTAFKIKNIDEDKDNFMKVKKGKFFIYFNKYKNSGRLGPQVIEIPAKLGKDIRHFMNINPYDYLIVNKLGKPVLQNFITKILNKLFDKNVSVSLLRHSYMTNQFGDVDLKKLNETTEAMGNSQVVRSLAYISKDEAQKQSKK